MSFRNVYADATRADSYATLEFANTYHLAFRDLPRIIHEHVSGKHALDFGCGTGRSTRFIRQLGFDTTGVDIAEEMIAKARELDTGDDYRIVPDDDFSGLEPAAYDLITSLFTFDNIARFETKLRIFRDLAGLLGPSGKLINVVSAPEIYLHEYLRSRPGTSWRKTGPPVPARRYASSPPSFPTGVRASTYFARTRAIENSSSSAGCKSPRLTSRLPVVANHTSGSVRRASRRG